MPQWQGGANPDYVFGAEVLAFIAPPSKTDATIKIAVNEDFNKPLETENGMIGTVKGSVTDPDAKFTRPSVLSSFTKKAFSS